MSRVRASKRVEGRTSQAEAVWYDPARWPSFVHGLAHIQKVEGDWPAAGSRVVWVSRPGGRGIVVEACRHHVVRQGQTVAVEDERLRGIQKITFVPDDDGCRIEVVLDFEIKQPGPLGPLVALFTRRPLRDGLRRTLERFAIEVREHVAHGT